MKNWVIVAALSMVIASIGGCGLDVAERPLPGAKGTGGDSYEVVVEFPDVGNLVPNSEVKVNDTTVGTVKDIDLVDWSARVTVGLEGDVRLPANARARIGQKSLLGSEYVELSVPEQRSESPDLLSEGDVIPLQRSGRYTDTEDLLSTVSLWLNGGGLQHVQTIATELNRALSGNEESTRTLVANLNRLVGGLDDQKYKIVSTIESVSELAGRLSEQRQTLGDAIDQLPDGLATLNRQRENLTSALAALDDLSVTSLRVIRSSGANLTQELEDLRPVLREINKAADVLPEALDIAGTVLFPVKAVPYVVKGDFLNSAFTLDLTIGGLARGFFPETGLDEAINLIQTALQATDPLTGPLTDGINDATVEDPPFDADDPEVPTDAPGAPTDHPAPDPPVDDGTGKNQGLLDLLFGGR